MYYKQGFVDNLLSQINIMMYISRFVELKQVGKYFWGLCPFHQEKSTSFMVDPFSGTFTCFGCGITGNVITFVMKYYKEDFVKAIERLSNEYGIPIKKDDEFLNTGLFNSQMLEKDLLYAVNKTAADYFINLLSRSDNNDGIKYFRDKRNFTNETIKKFSLGYMDSNPEALYNYLIINGFNEETIFKSKLMGRTEKGKLYSFFRNRAIIPIFDRNHRVIGFGGRVLVDGELPKYLNTPETIVFDKKRNLFGFNHVKDVKEKGIIICEGYMDVIALHQAGFTNAVASLGTAFTQEQASIIHSITDQIFLSFDADDAGSNAALKSINICKKENLNARVINMDPYKDPDEFIQLLGSEIYQKRIDESIPDKLFLLRYLEKKMDLKNQQDINFKNLPNKIVDFARLCSKNFPGRNENQGKFMVKYSKIFDLYFEFIEKH